MKVFRIKSLFILVSISILVNVSLANETKPLTIYGQPYSHKLNLDQNQCLDLYKAIDVKEESSVDGDSKTQTKGLGNLSISLQKKKDKKPWWAFSRKDTWTIDSCNYRAITLSKNEIEELANNLNIDYKDITSMRKLSLRPDTLSFTYHCRVKEYKIAPNLHIYISKPGRECTKHLPANYNMVEMVNGKLEDRWQEFDFYYDHLTEELWQNEDVKVDYKYIKSTKGGAKLHTGKKSNGNILVQGVEQQIIHISFYGDVAITESGYVFNKENSYNVTVKKMPNERFKFWDECRTSMDPSVYCKRKFRTIGDVINYANEYATESIADDLELKSSSTTKLNSF